jgi:hypothetical protein
MVAQLKIHEMQAQGRRSDSSPRKRQSKNVAKQGETLSAIKMEGTDVAVKVEVDDVTENPQPESQTDTQLHLPVSCSAGATSGVTHPAIVLPELKEERNHAVATPADPSGPPKNLEPPKIPEISDCIWSVSTNHDARNPNGIPSCPPTPVLSCVDVIPNDVDEAAVSLLLHFDEADPLKFVSPDPSVTQSKRNARTCVLKSQNVEGALQGALNKEPPRQHEDVEPNLTWNWKARASLK